jgi:hypothetical protein
MSPVFCTSKILFHVIKFAVAKNARFPLFRGLAPLQMLRALTGAAVALLAAGPLYAQAPVGNRASGLGAFVAVADDATAVYWNPSGLATGAIVSLAVDYGRSEQLPSAGDIGGGERLTAGFGAFSVPPLGLSYYRLGSFAASASQAAVQGSAGREEVARSVQSVVTSVAGVTLLHSLSDHLVVGGSIKLVRGETAAGTSRSADVEGAVGNAERLRRVASTTGDVDLSATWAVDRIRAGIVARNLTTPAFALDGAGSAAVELDRQVRVGGAWGSGWPGVSRWIAAVDADLTPERAVSGDRRDVAAGVERWWLGQRLGLRGGLRGSLEGTARPVASVGASAALARGVYVDAHLARGQDDQRSWGIGARIAF